MFPFRLQRAFLRFVKPYYLGLSALPEHPETLTRFLNSCSSLDERTAEMLLTEPEWRGRQTVSWMIGVNRWEQFVPQMVRQLLASEVVYAGSGYCVGLALIASEEAQNGLVEYLDTWLPEYDSPYDQHWAMGALIEVDRVRGTLEADRFLADDGLWDSWLAAQPGWTTSEPVEVGKIVALIRAGPTN